MNWNDFFNQEFIQKQLNEIEAILEKETGNVFPEASKRFTAFELTPYDAIKVVILGQDPYHGQGQAMGLSFSVPKGVRNPKSLINIYKELEDDLGISKVTGDLTMWAKQGVFLFNTLLSVREKEPLSHQDIGWEVFSDAVIKTLSDRKEPIIFLLWGKWAQSKAAVIASHHIILESAHPSPLSAYRGFFGSKPFSTINEILIDKGKVPIDWSLE